MSDINAINDDFSAILNARRVSKKGETVTHYSIPDPAHGIMGGKYNLMGTGFSDPGIYPETICAAMFDTQSNSFEPREGWLFRRRL